MKSKLPKDKLWRLGKPSHRTIFISARDGNTYVSYGIPIMEGTKIVGRVFGQGHYNYQHPGNAKLVIMPVCKRNAQAIINAHNAPITFDQNKALVVDILSRLSVLATQPLGLRRAETARAEFLQYCPEFHEACEAAQKMLDEISPPPPPMPGPLGEAAK